MTNSIIRNQQDQVRALIDEADSVGIIIGHAQTVDTVAAALALYLVLETSGKNTQIVALQEPTVEVSSLVGIDRVAKSFEGLTRTLTISVPYREGEIEKVSYNIEQDRLNVNLFAESAGITFSEKDVEYIRKGSSPSLIITVGVTNEDEVKSLVDLKTVKTIHIDRNPLNTIMGDVSLIDPSFSSNSEIVADLLMSLAFPHDIDAYQNLMDGIVAATNNFTQPATSAFAFEAAGFLLQNGAKRKQQEIQTRAQRDTFPKEDYFLGNQQKGDRFAQDKLRQELKQQGGQSDDWSSQPVQPAGGPRQPQNMPRPKQTNNQGRPQFNSQNSARPQQQNVQPPRPVSVPKEMTNEGLDMPDEAQYTEGSTGEVPDDWFLPKVFKGSKKGN